MAEARAAMTPFFPSDCPDLVLDSPLVEQASRARQAPPEIRSHVSSKYKPNAFWQELDALNMSKEEAYTENCKKMPKHWDTVTRPIIAKLYKAGVIDNSATNNPSGVAIAAKEESSQHVDLYIDYRQHIKDIRMPRNMEECPTKESLLNSARKYARDQLSARFALLRLWSAPHFYPLILGLENRVINSFADPVGRAWEWKFVPKDMPYSEWSMHHSSQLRLKPFRWLMKDNVIISRNLFMVMAPTEADLLKLATAMTFAIQTDPWRLEVDLWRSFINVDMQFLEEMRGEWLE